MYVVLEISRKCIQLTIVIHIIIIKETTCCGCIFFLETVSILDGINIYKRTYVAVSIQDCHLLFPTGADEAELGSPNVRWQTYECGPSDSYHAYTLTLRAHY